MVASPNPAHVTRRIGAMRLTLKSDLEIELSRVFNAPKRLVFEAHARPEHVRQWWGRGGTTMTSCEMDFRPGGKWRYVIQKASGHAYAFRGEYREIVAPDRFVQTFEFEGMGVSRYCPARRASVRRNVESSDSTIPSASRT